MKYFDDNAGDRWTIELTVGRLLKIKSSVGLDLLDKPGGLPQDFAKWVDVLWVTLEKQVEARQLKPEDFAERLFGDVLAKAIDLFVQELADFFLALQPSTSEAIRGIWLKTKELEKYEADQVTTALGKLSFDLPALPE